MHSFLLVGIGGALGSMARYGVTLWAGAPYGTLIVNVIGSFLLGFVLHLSTATNLLTDDLRLALTTGALGGFTTYSTFNHETMALLREAWVYGTWNLVATVAGSLIAGAIGVALARLVAGR